MIETEPGVWKGPMLLALERYLEERLPTIAVADDE
jgi:hypothetical protein